MESIGRISMRYIAPVLALLRRQQGLLALLFVGLLLLGAYYYLFHGNQRSPVIIALAGGTANSNAPHTLAALDHHFKRGVNMLAIGFVWADGMLSCLHDANSETGVASPQKTNGQVQSTPACTIKELAEWMKKHPSAVIVARVHGDEAKGFKTLRGLPDASERVVLQVTNPKLATAASEAGLYRLIWQPAGDKIKLHKVMRVAARHKVSAVAVPKEVLPKARRGRKKLVRSKVAVYAYHIRNCGEASDVLARGASGYYTDHLAAGSC